MKKGGGIGPLKPWQPLACNTGKGAKSNPSVGGKDKLSDDHHPFFIVGVQKNYEVNRRAY